MTELEIPPDATEEEAAKLVVEFVAVGDEIEVKGEEMTETSGDGRERASGRVTAIEPGYLEIDGDSPHGESVRYDEIHLVTRLDT